MLRIVLYVLITVGGFRVARALWPALRTRRGAGAYWALTATVMAVWLLPYVSGHSVRGGGRVAYLVHVFSASWLVAGLVVIVIGSFWRVAIRAADLIRRWSRPAAKDDEVDEARRGLLVRAGQAVPLSALAVGAGEVLNGSGSFTVKRAEVRLRKLAPALEGFRIGQITDLHVGAFIDAAYLQRAVEAMNAEKVDLQVMTGDLIDDLQQLDETFVALQQCRAPHGMLAILGNHEHWRGLDVIVPRYEKAAREGGVKLLVDESVLLHHNGAKVRVVGTDYPMSGGPGGRERVMAQQAETAFKDVAPDETVLCLAHHPEFFPFASEKGARLTLSGHTHGGQLAILGIPVFGFVFRYMLGWYRRGENQLYVSGGTGHWLPFRIGVPTEVTILTLRSV